MTEKHGGILGGAPRALPGRANPQNAKIIVDILDSIGVICTNTRSSIN